ncbi:unnamed protein product, partial [Didymodactylos carnosus]
PYDEAANQEIEQLFRRVTIVGQNRFVATNTKETEWIKCNESVDKQAVADRSAHVIVNMEISCFKSS